MKDGKLFIRNMVCDRCISAVKSILEKNKISYQQVLLGEVQLKADISREKKEKLGKDLQQTGFELIDDRKTQIIEKMKRSMLKYIEELPDSGRTRLSEYIMTQLKYDYSYLSSLFSSVEGVTVEHYFIRQRVEKVKELLVYDQLSLSEIAYELGFSSVHHLSAQFKKVSGLTPTHFKKIGASKRKVIDKA